MKILIYGTGAVGSAFGGFLSRDHEVTLLGRGKHLAAIRRQGLRVSGIWGRHIFRKFRLVSDESRLRRKPEPYDLILVTVKSYDTARAARGIQKLLSPRTLVVSLQNGLGNVEALRRMIPANRILAGRVIFGVEHHAPGKIKITVMASPTAVGEITQHQISVRARLLARVFDRAGIPSVACPDVQSLLWAKVIYNAALNPLASLMDCHYGYLGDNPATRLIMDEVIDEIYRVAERADVRLVPDSPKGYRKIFYSQMVPRTYNHHPSMLQDLNHGKRTEIEAINGAIVRIAKKVKLAVPVNAELVRLIRKKERLC